MRVVVQGTNDFDDYQIFLRAIGVSLSSLKEDDFEVTVYSLGPANVHSFVSEFCNISERGMKARGKKIKFFKANTEWLEENISYIDYFVYLSKPSQPFSKSYYLAKNNNVETGIFQY